MTTCKIMAGCAFNTIFFQLSFPWIRDNTAIFTHKDDFKILDRHRSREARIKKARSIIHHRINTTRKKTKKVHSSVQYTP